MFEPFNQPPPELGNQYDDDPMLRQSLRRMLGDEILAEIEQELRHLGDLAGGELYRESLADRENEPRLVQWNGWGERVDHIELTSVWKRAHVLAAELGVVAAAYDGKHGAQNRIHQLALAYLFVPSTDYFGCPLAMTDGAARTILEAQHPELAAEAVPHLTSREPADFWTSGQWMTESTGGSDVGRSETRAVLGDDGQWRLWGRKWFTSAATSEMALTLARPEGNPPGGSGLALFYVRCHDADGRLQNIRIHRLKDKLGTRKLPTAELWLDGAVATPVRGTKDGVRHIAPMLNVTRTWNALTAVASMRRGIALARDYAKKRVAFGAPLSEKALHIDTLAGLQAELEGAFQLTFFVGELLGRHEHHELDADSTRLLRLLTPVTKLTTARQAVSVVSEVLEAFGGAGYVEDTGLPVLLRDTQVLSIWEGTTNVLALDAIRALDRGEALRVLTTEAERWVAAARDPGLHEAAGHGLKALRRAADWLEHATRAGHDAVEAGARRFALTLGRACELILLCRHAQWALEVEKDRRARAAALRLAQSGVDRIAWADGEDAYLLANGHPRAQ